MDVVPRRGGAVVIVVWVVSWCCELGACAVRLCSLQLCVIAVCSWCYQSLCAHLSWVSMPCDTIWCIGSRCFVLSIAGPGAGHWAVLCVLHALVVSTVFSMALCRTLTALVVGCSGECRDCHSGRQLDSRAQVRSGTRRRLL